MAGCCDAFTFSFTDEIKSIKPAITMKNFKSSQKN